MCYCSIFNTKSSPFSNAIFICSHINSILNGYEDRKELDYADDVPLYQAETLDVPESPKHSKLLGITVQLQVGISLIFIP